MHKPSARLGLVAICSLMTLPGCVPQVSEQQIITGIVSDIKHRPGTVLIAVSGVKNHSWIKPEIFEEGVLHSFTQSGVFTQIVTTGKSDYLLEAKMIKLSQRNGLVIGTGTTGVADISWTLTKIEDHKIVYQAELTTEFKSHEFSGVSRVKAAKSGCIQENIREAIEQIGNTSW